MVVIRSVPPDLAQLVSAEEHLFLLRNPAPFNRLLRKDDFLDEGVAAIFGLAAAKVELLALGFHFRTYTPAQATAWLTERGFASPAAPNPTVESSPRLEG